MQFAFPHHPHSSEVFVLIILIRLVVVKEAETVRLTVHCLPFEVHCQLYMFTALVNYIRMNDLYGPLEPPESIEFA